MIFVVGEKILIKAPTKELLEWCEKNLTLSNPEYYKLERLGKYTGRTVREFKLFEITRGGVLLPFGCFKQLYATFKGKGEFTSVIHASTRVFYDSNIKPYPYQENAIGAILRAKNGIIVAPCGSGKTQIALETIARLGQRALWITHTTELLAQSLERAKILLNLKDSDIGTITGGAVKVGDKITFATVQTLVNVDREHLKDAFDVIVVDECHKAVGTPTKMMMFYKVLSSLSARYKIGITATPKRADGLERSMLALIGDVVYTITKKDVEQYTCPVKVEKIETGYTPNLDVALGADGTIVYTSLIHDLVTNDKRNKKIANDLFDLVKLSPKVKILVLSERVEHLTRLKNELRATAARQGMDLSAKIEQLSALSYSRAAREARKEILSDLNFGRLNVVFATYALAKEGLDIPNLNYVVFASPVKDATTVEQSAGRVGRRADGKSYGTVIDYTDSLFGMLAGFSRKRNSVYKKLSYEVTEKCAVQIPLML